MQDAATRRELLAAGWTPRQIARAVQVGDLLRLRRGHYGTAALDLATQQAVRVGGRLTCVSELRHRGVWVREAGLHVHVPANAARLRRPDERFERLAPGDAVVHWSVLGEPSRATASHVSLVDALATAAECLPDRELLAALDSAVYRGLLSRERMRGALGGRSARLRRLLPRVRGSAQSGLESIVRLLAEDLGFRVATQVRFPGIGIADLVVEGWIVIETDGAEFHDSASVSANDRRRDARHASAGRTPLRFRYGQVMFELPTVAMAIIGAVGTHRRVRNSGELARRAVLRARRLRIS